MKTTALNSSDQLAALDETGQLGERQIAFYRTPDF